MRVSQPVSQSVRKAIDLVKYFVGLFVLSDLLSRSASQVRLGLVRLAR